MTKVKICGLRTEDQLDAALEAGADLVGLVLYPRSPRNIDLATAASLSRRAHERGRASVVVLLVDPSDALVDTVVATVKPDMLQLHGLETPERVGEIRGRAGVPIMKALRIAEAADVETAPRYLAPGRIADLILFDAKPSSAPGSLPGGNGLAFDWQLLAPLRGRMAFALAGGLTPENAQAAAELTGASLLDVSSGVERSPGEKDPALIRRFLQEAKAAKQA